MTLRPWRLFPARCTMTDGCGSTVRGSLRNAALDTPVLGRPAPLATASLEAALAATYRPSGGGSVHTDLAATGLQRRDLDQFAAHAETALQLAGETGSGYVTRRLKGLRPQLGDFADDQRVRDIAGRIGSLEVVQ